MAILPTPGVISDLLNNFIDRRPNYFVTQLREQTPFGITRATSPNPHAPFGGVRP
jgi:hypothetical protein